MLKNQIERTGRMKILTFGVFDYFHIGHLRLFKQCREYADYLIVAVQNGEYLVKYKPGAKIFYTTEERVEILKSIKEVDEVLVYNECNTTDLSAIDFDILALGEDHVGTRFDEMQKWCKQHGKSLVRLKRTKGVSSTDIKEDLDGR